MPKSPVRVAVTGAAGQIGYSLLFRIASGEMLGKDQPVILQMLEIPDEKAQKALKGVMMELDDCAFPLLHGMVPHPTRWSHSRTSSGTLVGARPRGPGMERKDLLEANGKIFGPQGKALDRVASRNVKVLVVGNPANTNCLIAMKNAPGLKPTQFTGMMRLDHNRAASQISQKISKPVTSSWERSRSGATTRRRNTPTYFRPKCEGKKVWPMINDQAWLEQTFIPTVQKRGAAIIDARGLSSAASAANAAIDHIRDWIRRPGRRLGNDGRALRRQLRHPGRRDLRLPGHLPRRQYQVVKGIEISDFSRKRIDATLKELHEERDSVKSLFCHERGQTFSRGALPGKAAPDRRHDQRLPRADGEARRVPRDLPLRAAASRRARSACRTSASRTWTTCSPTSAASPTCATCRCSWTSTPASARAPSTSRAPRAR